MREQVAHQGFARSAHGLTVRLCADAFPPRFRLSSSVACSAGRATSRTWAHHGTWRRLTTPSLCVAIPRWAPAGWMHFAGGWRLKPPARSTLKPSLSRPLLRSEEHSRTDAALFQPTCSSRRRPTVGRLMPLRTRMKRHLPSGASRKGWRSPEGEVLRTFAIITTPANREMSALHDRMPLVLEQPDWRLWLGDDAGDAAELLRPAPDGTLRAWPVSAARQQPTEQRRQPDRADDNGCRWRRTERSLSHLTRLRRGNRASAAAKGQVAARRWCPWSGGQTTP